MTLKKKMNNLTTWNREDRDLLVELRTDMKVVRDDLKQMKDGNAIVTGDHEGRIRSLEEQRNKWLGKESGVGALVGLMAGLLGAFIQAHK